MATQIDLGAPIIRAAQARLADATEGLPARIAVFNAEAVNLVDLELPTTYVFGVLGEHIAYPTIEVVIGQGTLGRRSIGDDGSPGDQDHDPRVTVIAWIYGSSGEERDLYEMALGFCRVIIEALSGPGAFGVTAEIADVPGAIEYRIEPVPDALTDDGRNVAKWKTAAAVTFRLEAVETWR